MMLAALAAVLLPAAGPQAPALTIHWWVNGMDAGEITPVGAYHAPSDTWAYSGFQLHTGTFATIDFDLAASATVDGLGGFAAADGGMIGGTITVENQVLPKIEVIIQVTLPVPDMPAGVLAGGNVGMTLISDANGATLNSLPGTPIWQVVDGGNSLAAFFDPFVYNTPGLCICGVPAGGGFPFPVPGPAVEGSMSTLLSFSLTLDDQLSCDSSITLVTLLGDLDGDGDVDTVDFLTLLGAWGVCDDPGDCPADLDGDGSVGASDFLALLGNWGP